MASFVTGERGPVQVGGSGNVVAVNVSVVGFSDAEMYGIDARGAWFGRRGGGGAGTWVAVFMLDDLDRVESTEDRREAVGDFSDDASDCTDDTRS